MFSIVLLGALALLSGTATAWGQAREAVSAAVAEDLAEALEVDMEVRDLLLG